MQPLFLIALDVLNLSIGRAYCTVEAPLLCPSGSLLNIWNASL